jgi:hypothetical protein
MDNWRLMAAVIVLTAVVSAVLFLIAAGFLAPR